MKTIIVIPSKDGAYSGNEGRVNIYAFPLTVTVSTKRPLFKYESVDAFAQDNGYTLVGGTPIPDDTPHYEELIEAGYSTTDQLLENDLTKVKGIGPVTAQKIINHIK